MRTAAYVALIGAIGGGLGLAGCAEMGISSTSGFTYKNITVAEGSALAGEGNNVLFKGEPLALSGTAVKTGELLRDVNVTQTDLSTINIARTKGAGKVRIISVVPSLDTPVCEQQTHYLSEKNNGLDKMIELITVSIDTPFAQKRFAQEANIHNVTFLSDYRGAEFGRAHGLLVKDLHVLARAVMVIGKDNTVQYLQITPEIKHLPDLEKAFQVARSLISAG
ncbi:MAG: thiol peroxidase [Nitrospira sp.]|nr:thiol peroxidase [Nitrospira sp.]MCP9443270.1 thiol peroxidase [Nitrospira sp.]